VYLAAGPTDLRRGIDGLCAIVEGVLEEAPLSGHVFLFANATRTRLKVLSGMASLRALAAFSSPSAGKLLVSETVTIIVGGYIDAAAAKAAWDAKCTGKTRSIVGGLQTSKAGR
jgi:hypothetical protein